MHFKQQWYGTLTSHMRPHCGGEGGLPRRSISWVLLVFPARHAVGKLSWGVGAWRCKVKPPTKTCWTLGWWMMMMVMMMMRRRMRMRMRMMMMTMMMMMRMRMRMMVVAVAVAVVDVDAGAGAGRDVDGSGCGCRMIFFCQTYCSHFQVSGHEISGNIQNFGFPRHQLQ